MKRITLILVLALAACEKKPPANPTDTTTSTDPTAPPPTTAPPPATPDATPDPAPVTPTTTPTTPPETKGSKSLDQAADLLQKKDPSAAAQAEELLKGSTDAPSLINLGVARFVQNDLAGAKRYWLSATVADPTQGHAWLYLGALQERDGDLNGALQTYKTGIASAPDDMELRAAQVATLRALGRPDEAVTAAKEALGINAKSVAVYNNLGLVYLDQGKLDLAKFVYQKALDYLGDDAQNNPYIHANLGRIYLLQGDKSHALFELNKAKELDAKLVPALVYLSSIYLDDHNYGDSVPLLEEARRQEPKNHGVLMNLGIAYRGIGRFDDAKAAWMAALDADPKDPAPYFNLGILYGDSMKLYDDSIRSFQQYVAAGGKQKDLALTYSAAVEKEKKRVEKEEAKRKKAEGATPTPAPGGTP